MQRLCSWVRVSDAGIDDTEYFSVSGRAVQRRRCSCVRELFSRLLLRLAGDVVSDHDGVHAWVCVSLGVRHW
jgi:hypothetical protein